MAIKKSTTIASAVAAAGTTASIWHASTATTMAVTSTAGATAGSGTMVFKTVAAGLGSKLLIGALCIGATAAVTYMVYTHLESKS